MSNTLEADLKDRLSRRAEEASTSLPLENVTRRVAARRRHRAALRGTTAALALVAAAAGLYGLQASRSADPVPTATASVVAETPLVQLDDVFMFTSVVKPGAIALQLADGQRLTIGVVGEPYYDGYNQALTVQIGATSNGWFQPLGAEVSAATESMLGGNDGVVYWTALPSSVTRVELHLASGATTWQTPVAGVAAFPVAAHSPDDTLIAYDASGNEVQRIAWSATHLVGSTTTGNDPTVHSDYSTEHEAADVPQIDVSALANLTQDQEDGYRAFGDDTMRACLNTNGEAAWTSCIASTDVAVKGYLAAINAPVTAEP
ncbi:MAG: hypothetical protein JWR83_1252 [Aeromicrobium sp.]|nr:hypothetical protein [Aeromicrobium sp.]